ncbi:MAG: nucleotide exchange factor GrpE [Alphaproteobacteria bacterium]|nr:nucleotide exchange factor GrpE [Alphaproteobacteria bacterium]
MSDENQSPENAEANGIDDAADVAALKAEMAEMKDRMLRALADAENTRRRAERERSDASQYAVTGFARDMLGVADNLRRALDALPAEILEAANPQLKAVIEGVEATERGLLSTLERHKVKIVDTSGKFDPNLHQAIAEVPGNGIPAGNIVNVVQTGYVIGDRLLRPAMVTVARAGDAPAPQGGVDTQA